MSNPTEREPSEHSTVTLGGAAASEIAVVQEAVRVPVSMTVNGGVRAMTVEPRTTTTRCVA